MITARSSHQKHRTAEEAVSIVAGIAILLCMLPVKAAAIPVVSTRFQPKKLDEPVQTHASLAPDEATPFDYPTSFGKIPLSFERNDGQTDERVDFIARGAGYTLFLTANEMVLGVERTRKPATDGQSASRTPAGRDTLQIKFTGSSSRGRARGVDELPSRSNYFIGNDPARWTINVPQFAQVRYSELYPGIDVVYYGNPEQLEYDFVVKPGADPRAIRMEVVGARGLNMDANGDLVVRINDDTEVRQRRPIVYQELKVGRVRVPASYAISGHHVEFLVGDFDPSVPLVLDPVSLVYSSYLGGTGIDYGTDVAVDAVGAMYVSGIASSVDFPLMNPYQNVRRGPNDVFVCKLNPGGSALVYATYLGGSGAEENNSVNAGGLAVDSSGAAYLTGVTKSADFPLMNEIQAVLAGTEDAFVSKLGSSGATLEYSTYLGGSGQDYGIEIEVDGSGSACVFGYTGSSDFPLENPFQETQGAMFVAKIHSSGSSFVFSTYFGTQALWGSMALDSDGAVYLTGIVVATGNVPLMNPIQGTQSGGNDAFVSKLNAAGTALEYSTYLGGTGGELGFGIAVDASGAAWVVGVTGSTDFPLENPLQGAGDAFVTKVNPSGSAWAFSSYLGGSGPDSVRDVAVDDSGAAYLTGTTSSTDLPVMNAFQEANAGGGSDAFVMKVTASGSAIAYASYLGGSGAEDGGQASVSTSGSIAVDSTGAAYVTGITLSSDFPVVNPYQELGSVDPFIAKIDDGVPCLPPGITEQPDSVATIISGQTIELSVSAQGAGPLQFQWYQGLSGDTSQPIAGATSPTYISPALTAPQSGPHATYSFWVRVLYDCGVGSSVEYSRTSTITVVTPVSVTTQPSSQAISSGQSAVLSVGVIGTGPLSYQWFIGNTPGVGTPISGATSSTYTSPALTTSTSYWALVSNVASASITNVATMSVIRAPIVVSTTADNGNDASPTPGSLRAAIKAANQNVGADLITFNITPAAETYSINLASRLPVITEPVTIDGNSQPSAVLGEPVVVLSGAAAGGVTVTDCAANDLGTGADGLHVAAGGAGSVIRGLVINRFTGDGIEFEGGGNATHASRVEGCFIGTNAAGTAAVANGRHGIYINDAAYVTVGGDRYPNGSLRYGCLISGNRCSGVEIRGGLASNNLIVGCNIGPDLTGHIPIGNGVGVRVDGAPDNTIGAAGDDASKKNRVGFNSGQGTVNTGTVSTGPQGAMPPDTQIVGTEIYGNGGEAIETAVPIAPVLGSAQITGTTLTVIGSATMVQPSTQYRVQYFTNTTCGVGGQGEVLIAGDVLKQSSPAGTLDLTFASSATTARPGELVAVTVTGPEGTSRFSVCEAVEGRLGVVAVETAVVNLGSLPGLRSGPAESGQTSPGLIASFAGPEDPDDPDVEGDEVVPPDAQAAVGPSHLLAVLNTEIAVQSKTDGTFVKRVDLDGFWAALKETPQEVLSAFNPRALFDPYAAGGGRYVIVATANPRQDSSAVLVAVSKTTDPTGDWNLYRYEAETAEVLWADYPTVGFTKDWVAVQVNLFSIGLDQFARTEVFALDKAALYAGAPGVGAGTVLGSREIGLTQVPAMTYDPNLTTLYLVQTGAGNLGGVGTVNVYTVSGPVGGETLDTTPQAYTTAETWLTPEAPMGLFAPQMGTTVKIDANDDRMHSVVYRNGRLYLAHTVFLPAEGPATRSAVQWWELNPGTQTVVQRGRIDDPGGLVYYAYPSLAVNSQGNVVIGYSRFSAETYATAAYQFREAGDAAGTLRGEAVLKAGEASYDKRLGDVRNRWGDYSSAAVDPVDDTKLWVLNEYAETPVTGTIVTVDRWGTWWGAVAGSPDCTLACPGNITIGTGAGATGCGVAVTYAEPTTTGTCGTVTCVPASGLTFPVGTTTVTCTATAGYVCSFTVTVTDTTVPIFTTCPGPRTIASGANCQAAVPNLVADAAATDNCPGVVITQSPAAGTLIGLGVQQITLTATDSAGNTATCPVQLTVADQTAPQITCPGSITMAAADGACSRVVNFPLTISDNCPGGITVTTSQPSGSEFAVGTTMVMVTATDVSGNSANCQFAVTIQDVTAPTIGCPANIQTVALTTAGRAVNFTPPTPTDACAGATVSCVPTPGSTFAIGTTTVTCTATDAANNSTNCQFTVQVAPLGTDTAGIYVPATGSWFLRNANSPGGADLVFGYGPPNLGWIALRGDWDGNGTDTAGLYDPVNGNFFLKNTNAGGGADLVYGFGPPGLGWRPLVGDWDGNGTDTIGLYDPASGSFFLRNTHAAGAADQVYGFGPAGLGWAPMVGDWDGNGTDTVGLYDPVNGNYFLRNAHAAGGADLVYGFGPPGLGWKPLSGDWNGDGLDTVGLYDPTNGFFFLRNTHAPGPADAVFGYGPPNTTPILGDWNGL